MTTSMSPHRPFGAPDDRFADVVGDAPSLVEVVAAAAHEGPVYVESEDALYFTSVPRREPAEPDRAIVELLRLALDGERFPLDVEALSVVSADANAANGMTLDLDGSLLVCEQGSFARPARIARVDRETGRSAALVDASGGAALNSPNDVVIARDGAVWFTDPSYGFLQGFRPAPLRPDAVYRFDRATAELEAVATGLDKPNGLAFSPDGSILYVGDSGAIHGPGDYDPTRPHQIVAFDVVDGCALGGGRSLAEIGPGFPDGLKVDTAGRIYVSCDEGVRVLSAGGEPLGLLPVPGAVNFCFGGPKRNVLFITNDAAVWAAVLNAKGA
jgi:gluconolactonase